MNVAKDLNPARWEAMKSEHGSLANAKKSDLNLCKLCFKAHNYCVSCKLQYKPGGNKGLTPANQEGFALAIKCGVVQSDALSCCYQRCRRKAKKIEASLATVVMAPVPVEGPPTPAPPPPPAPPTPPPSEEELRSSAAADFASSGRRTVVALFDFTANSDTTRPPSNYLRLTAGEVIIEVRPVKDGWWTGCSAASGLSGEFPYNYTSGDPVVWAVQNGAGNPACEVGRDPVATAPRDTLLNLSPVVHSYTYSVGELVTVKSQTYVGINKPGGAGRVTYVHSDGRLDVSFHVEGGSDRGVDPCLVAPMEISSVGDRSARRCSTPISAAAGILTIGTEDMPEPDPPQHGSRTGGTQYSTPIWRYLSYP